MTAGRTLTDDDVEAIAAAVARLLHLRERAAPTPAPRPVTISPITQAAARAELERRGLRTPKRR